MLEIEQISFGRAFHNFGAASRNDLSLKVVLVGQDDATSRRPLDDDLNLYALGFSLTRK